MEFRDRMIMVRDVDTAWGSETMEGGGTRVLSPIRPFIVFFYKLLEGHTNTTLSVRELSINGLGEASKRARHFPPVMSLESKHDRAVDNN